jgi:GNAT superfamily N-acetyltransferase
MWRVATASDDEGILSMCMALNSEDPGPAPVEPEQVRRTLTKLREQSNRGRAVVCDIDGRAVGYALLISFWSNQLGGEVCNIDELFVAPEYRGRRLATTLFKRLADGGNSLWPRPSHSKSHRKMSVRSQCISSLDFKAKTLRCEGAWRSKSCLEIRESPSPLDSKAVTPTA